MQRLSHVLTLVVAGVGLAGSAFGQGTDSCASPTAIAGVGSFAFNNSAATTGSEGQANSVCSFFTSTAITRDVWFVWTAPSTNTFELTTCSLTTVDTKIAVYAGLACPASAALDCSDDDCGGAFQSTVQFAATSGSTYVIQLGTYPLTGGGGDPGGTGSFSISVYTPPPPCSTSVGPDVIVGDLQDIANYAAAGGLDAITVGTYSCNIGTANVNWIAGDNRHPVIGGNLYRYRVQSGAGRFEQIGMSWLKHGFLALSNTLCCANCQGTDGSTLGVNCADPYTASRNGGQSGLGPRWQVNAHTGVFAYPPASPTFSGSTARRIEFLQTDVDTTAGVRYFSEAQYVTQDDAAAGNQNNNASYREVSVNGAGSTWSLLGTTQREQAAIRAWAVCETGVTLNDVQVTGDGLFVVGYKATSLGGGQYHYEYAVYNMNADRNAGRFSVPLPAGVTLSNVGFHDVTYRNTDGATGSANYSGADWTVTQTASSISWACVAESVDANANALRWGSTYNFRFDANAAPTAGLARLGLWKAGSPGEMTTTVDVPSGGTFTNFCAGDGTGTACPCGNNSPVGNAEGCLSSLSQGGRLRGSGSPSIGGDTLTLTSTQVPNGPALYFQGSGQMRIQFGDGLLCAGGTIIRLGVVFAAGNTSAYPNVGAPLVSVQGLDAAGDVRDYQAWYRDAATFCTTATFNLTNVLQLAWQP